MQFVILVVVFFFILFVILKASRFFLLLSFINKKENLSPVCQTRQRWFLPMSDPLLLLRILLEQLDLCRMGFALFSFAAANPDEMGGACYISFFFLTP